MLRSGARAVAALLVVSLLLALPTAMTATNPTISYNLATGTTRVQGGEEVTYTIQFTAQAATGQSTVDLDIAYRDRSATHTVAWNASLRLERVGTTQTQALGAMAGFDHSVNVDDLFEGTYRLVVRVITADNPAQYSSFIEVGAARPDGTSRVSAGDFRFDFNVDPPIDTDGDGISDVQEERLKTDKEESDTDGDGLTDCQEAEHTSIAGCQDPTFTAVDGGYGTDPTKADTDGDTLSDFDELNFNTDPTKADTDGDGLTDEKELDLANDTDPNDPDSDDDGLNDGDEVNTWKSDPREVDTDGDGLTDGEEAHGTRNARYGGNSTDPTKTDSDGDNLTDCQELRHTNAQECTSLTFPGDDGGWGTDPNKEDTDGDGIPDTNEVGGRTDPLKADTDDDGLDDHQEIATHLTEPDNPDTDGDGLDDGDEVNTWKTNPLNPDTDGDGLTDGEEVHTHKSNPLVSDSDDDGLPDGDEVKVHGTDPAHFDTDRDGLDDREEIQAYKTDPLDDDSDDDGLDDGDEVALGTDPANPDTDGDTWSDGVEVRTGGNPLNNLIVPSDIDGDHIADVEDDDADGDGRPDDGVARDLSTTLGGSLRVGNELGRRDVASDGTVTARITWNPVQGASAIQVWTWTDGAWTPASELAADATAYPDTASTDGARYRVTALLFLGAKEVGRAADPDNITWFGDLPSVEVFVTGVQVGDDGRTLHLRNGQAAERAFDITLTYTDAEGERQHAPVGVSVPSQAARDVTLDVLANAQPGSGYEVHWDDGGEDVLVAQGSIPGKSPSDGPNWLLWGGIGGGVLVLVAVGVVVLVRLRK